MAHHAVLKPKDVGSQGQLGHEVPPLPAGDSLPRVEFENRYTAHPDIKKAELIDGVVYMPSPTRYLEHAAAHFQLNTWLGLYCIATPGV